MAETQRRPGGLRFLLIDIALVVAATIAISLYIGASRPYDVFLASCLPIAGGLVLAGVYYLVRLLRAVERR